MDWSEGEQPTEWSEGEQPTDWSEVELPTDWDTLMPEGEMGYEPAFDESGGGTSTVSGGGVGAPTTGGLKTKSENVESGGWHASSRLTVYDQDVDGPLSRSTRDLGNGYLSESMLSFDARPDSGPVTQGQLLLRSSDDHEIYGVGPLTRLEGLYFERALDQKYSIRVGDVLPQFSRYSIQQAGRGFLLSRLSNCEQGSTQLSLVAAEVQHEEDTSFRRNAIGFRAGRAFKVGRKAQLAFGGQLISYRDVESSLSLPHMSTAFPDDDVVAVDATFDHPWGVHGEAELGRSTSQAVAPDGTHVTRRGHAERELVAVTREGRALTLERERIDVTFDSPQSSATPDVERQSATVQVPVLGERLAWNATFQRTYNDVRDLEGRRLDAKTHKTGLQSRPFASRKNRYLAGLALGAGVQYTRQRSTDATTRRDGREMTWSIAENAGRLALGWEFRTSLDEDLLAAENSREPNHWSYQASYEIPFGRNNHGSLKPSVSVGHDRDRNLLLALEDRANQFSAGFTGNWGPRSTFGFTRDESVQRQVVAARNVLSRTHRADWSYRLDPEGTWVAGLVGTRQENLDSSLEALGEERALVTCVRRW